jgi:hypothetical protein
VRLAEAVGVKRLALTHHDPMRSDEQLDELIARARDGLGAEARLEVFGAAEGLELDLEAPVSDNAVDQIVAGENMLLGDGQQPLLLLVTDDPEVANKMSQAVGADPVQIIRPEAAKARSGCSKPNGRGW